MNDSSAYEALVVKALFGELSVEESQRLDALLKADPSRAAAFQEMKATVELTADRPRPTPDPAYWEASYDRLMERIETLEQDPPRRTWYGRLADLRRSERWERWVPAWRLPALGLPFAGARPWALQLVAAAVLVAVGVAIGLSLADAPIVQTPAPAQVAEADPTAATPEYAALTERTGHYLDRSKVLLLGLVNMEVSEDASEAINWTHKQEIARELVQEAHLLKDELSDRDDRRLLRLLQDLEVILLQIANLETAHDLASIELVQSGVDQRAVLLKINLAKMRMSASPEPQGADRDTDAARPENGI